eukprot:Sdes_comp19371_c0_seq1m10627
MEDFSKLLEETKKELKKEKELRKEFKEECKKLWAERKDLMHQLEMLKNPTEFQEKNCIKSTQTEGFFSNKFVADFFEESWKKKKLKENRNNQQEKNADQELINFSTLLNCEEKQDGKKTQEKEIEKKYIFMTDFCSELEEKFDQVEKEFEEYRKKYNENQQKKIEELEMKIQANEILFKAQIENILEEKKQLQKENFEKMQKERENFELQHEKEILELEKIHFEE